MGCFTSHPDVEPKGRLQKKTISLDNITMIKMEETPKFFAVTTFDFVEDPSRKTDDPIVRKFYNTCDVVKNASGDRLYIAILKKDNIYFTYGGQTTKTIHDRWIADRGSHLNNARSGRAFTKNGPTFDDIWGSLKEPYHLYIMLYKNNLQNVDTEEKALIRMLCENQAENVMVTNIQHTNKMRNREKILKKLSTF